MNTPHAEISAERLRELFHYDPDTGVFTRRVGGMGRGCVAGQAVGSDNGEGYLRVMIEGVRYKLHRLAWLYMTGKWPEHEVDHRDTNPSNNRWKNLRDVPRMVNQQNQRSAQRSNKASGLLGVRRSKNKGPLKWDAVITADGQRIRLGSAETPEAAHEIYLAAKRRLHAGCTL